MLCTMSTKPFYSDYAQVRDEDLRERHRLWGVQCQATDIDCLLLEYCAGEPCALIEYKFHRATTADPEFGPVKAIGKLATYANLPAYMVRWKRDPWLFEVHALNGLATGFFSEVWEQPGEETAVAVMGETAYVRFLHKLRGRVASDAVLDRLGAQ